MAASKRMPRVESDCVAVVRASTGPTGSSEGGSTAEGPEEGEGDGMGLAFFFVTIPRAHAGSPADVPTRQRAFRVYWRCRIIK
jgi:hypothetical protein